MRFFFVAALSLIPSLANAAVCPLGPRETSLTFTRVMRDFGTLTASADSVATLGQGDPSSITSADIQTAIAKLELAEACASAVLQDETGTLLPEKADGITGATKDAYVKLFRDTMQNFLEGLTAYEGEFAKLLAEAPADRAFAEAARWSKEIDDRATHAHEILQ